MKRKICRQLLVKILPETNHINGNREFYEIFCKIFKVEAKLWSRVLLFREIYVLFLLRKLTQQLLKSGIDYYIQQENKKKLFIVLL